MGPRILGEPGSDAAGDDAVASLRAEADRLQRAVVDGLDRIAELEASLARLQRRSLAFRWQRLLNSIRKRMPSRRTRTPPTVAKPARPSPALPASPSPVTFTPRIVWIGGEPETPGYQYRVVRWAAAARCAGARVSAFALDALGRHFDEVEAADLVVLWRAAWDERVAAVVATARRHRARIAYDIDDLVFDPTLARVETIDGIRSQGLAPGEVAERYSLQRRTALAADFCTASTAELARALRRLGKPAWVLPNGFDEATFAASRLAARRRRRERTDDLLRIGYAGGTRTHQQDFRACATALARVLQAHPQVRLVLFRDSRARPLLDPLEYPELARHRRQIEWRDEVPLAALPAELARFDINLAPLEAGNPYCEAKSELKHFEAALAGVCTIASPTGPFARAISDGVTGRLAGHDDAWQAAVEQLVAAPEARAGLAAQALRVSLWRFGPERRVALAAGLLERLCGEHAAARADALAIGLADERFAVPRVPEASVEFDHDSLVAADATVVLAIDGDVDRVVATLESCAAQRQAALDLVLCGSADAGGPIRDWLAVHASRFGRARLLTVAPAEEGAMLALDAAIDAADTWQVLWISAGARLAPGAVESMLAALRESGAAALYVVRSPLLHRAPVLDWPLAMAIGSPALLLGKGGWSATGGLGALAAEAASVLLRCRLVERGLPAAAIAAAHVLDCSGTCSDAPDTDGGALRSVAALVRRAHPWVELDLD